jgi:hypothetical protein
LLGLLRFATLKPSYVTWETRRTIMIKRIVLAFAIVAGLTGAAVVTAQTAAACTDQHTS